jgi:hypothetical protein
MSDNEEDIYLNDVWCFYFHDPYDNDWTNSSYKLLGTISTVDEYWQHHKSIGNNINKGMFFLMRDYVFPCWDDPTNINGGCLSIKVLKEHVHEFWEDMSIKMLGEGLLMENQNKLWNNINGISTSPKKHFCIIKIWLKDDTLNHEKYFNILKNYYGDILYKLNKDNIQNEHTKK